MTKEILKRLILLFCFLMIAFLDVVSAQAAQDILTTLNVASIRDIRGRHSRDQSIEVLNTKVLSGETDDWDQYIEFAPNSRRGYAGILTFQLPANISPDNVQRITLNVNYQGPESSEQRWTWKIRDFETRRNVFLGDNEDAQDWNWTSMSFTVGGGSYIASDGKIRIRFSSNSAYDVCNIDFLQIQLHMIDDDPGTDDPGTDDPIAKNQAPVIDAGDDQSITLPLDTVLLSADVSDDGLPEGGSLQMDWRMQSGPAEVTIASADQSQTEVVFTAPGEYQFELIVTDGELTASDSLIVRVTEDQSPGESDFKDISLKSRITHVQPMTGIVFWTDSGRNNTDSIQLEYAYTPFNRVVKQKDEYNWSYVDQLLNQAAARGHQAILRFYYVYPGEYTTVPDYIKNSAGYNETKGQSEGQTTYFPDWSSEELQSFTLDFYTKFAERYDDDARMAFLQVGFGLWGEYHIYDGPMVLGKTFPSKAFQAEFAQHLDSVFKKLPWNISIDAADTGIAPYGNDAELLALGFGLFDDSFLHKTHNQYNADCFKTLNYEHRYQNSPMGGELSYYSNYDQQHALDPTGPYGTSFEVLASQYHISYMIGNDQPNYQSLARIAEAGLATGYKFQITAFKASATEAFITVKNTGIAPIYYDAYIAVNGVRSQISLKGLLPGQSRDFNIAAGGAAPEMTIECDRLVPGQQIEFDADL